MALKTRRWDPTETLATKEDIAAYLDAVLEDGDPDLLKAALGDIARAKGMAQVDFINEIVPQQRVHQCAIGIAGRGVDDQAGRLAQHDALRAARLREDRAVDPDQVAGGVDERAARVARIDGSIGLDEIVVWPAADNPPLGADNSRGNGLPQAEGISDSHDPFTHFEGIAVTEGRHGEVVFRFDLEQRKVQLFISSLRHGLELPRVGKLDLDFIGARNYMVVGKDVSVIADNETCAEAAGRLRPSRGLFEKMLEEIIERSLSVLPERGVGLHSLRDNLRSADVHDRGFVFLREFDEIRAHGFRECCAANQGKGENGTGCKTPSHQQPADAVAAPDPGVCPSPL